MEKETDKEKEKGIINNQSVQLVNISRVNKIIQPTLLCFQVDRNKNTKFFGAKQEGSGIFSRYCPEPVPGGTDQPKAFFAKAVDMAIS